MAHLREEHLVEAEEVAADELGKREEREGIQNVLTPVGACQMGMPYSGTLYEEAYTIEELKELDQRITPGNAKMGKIWNFSIPAYDSVSPIRGEIMRTCPGATRWCRVCCYAQRGFYNLPKVREGHVNNLLDSLRSDFPDRVVEVLQRRRRKPFFLRIHTAGDFYSPEYIEKWMEVARRLPNWRFYFYTRDWLLDDFRPKLEEFKAMDNVTGLASTDEDTGPPPDGWLEYGINYSYRQREYSEPAIKCPGITCERCRRCILGRGHTWTSVRCPE